MIFGTSAFPVPPADWYMFSTLAQAQKVFALAKANNPTASLQLVDGSLDGEAIFFMLPGTNPQGIAVWLIKGSVPGPRNSSLVMDDYAGDVWDRGPEDQGFGGSPGELDTNGAYGGLGGENLVYFDAGSGLAEFKWSESPQQPVS
jgi:hypothetical protein